MGLSPRVAFEASSPEVVADLAARGFGVAFLPAEFRADRLAVLRIDPPRLRGRLVLAWRARGPVSPVGRALVGHVREALAAPDADPDV